jgi:hypothetical protein
MNNPEKLAALGTQSKKGRQKTKAKNTTQYMLHTNFSSVVTAKRRLSGNSRWACTIFLQWLMLE